MKRPARGTPEATRARLVDTALVEFNRAGYHATDSNRLARAAGYAPGTFYKHFAHKQAIFLAAYVRWVEQEGAAIAAVVAAGGAPVARAARLVDTVIEFHRRWKGFRASLRALLAADAQVRAFHRKQRRRQLDGFAALRREAGRAARAREDDALVMLALERTADALADGEAIALGLRPAALRARLCALVETQLGWSTDDRGKHV